MMLPSFYGMHYYYSGGTSPQMGTSPITEIKMTTDTLDQEASPQTTGNPLTSDDSQGLGRTSTAAPPSSPPTPTFHFLRRVVSNDYVFIVEPFQVNMF